MRILGVSGSPIPDSNTDRAVQLVLRATGLRKAEFVKLSEQRVAACTGCLGCIKTNRCVLNDDGLILAEKVFKADVLVVGGFTPYGSLDSRTKSFLERLYPLHHRHGLLADKVGAGIITCVMGPEQQAVPSACCNGLQAIRSFMEIEAMRYAGGVAVPGNVPCVHCGEDGQCSQSGLKVLYGAQATPQEVGVRKLEDDAATMAALEQLAEKIMTTYYDG